MPSWRRTESNSPEGGGISESSCSRGHDVNKGGVLWLVALLLLESSSRTKSEASESPEPSVGGVKIELSGCIGRSVGRELRVSRSYGRRPWSWEVHSALYN